MILLELKPYYEANAYCVDIHWDKKDDHEREEKAQSRDYYHIEWSAVLRCIVGGHISTDKQK